MIKEETTMCYLEALLEGDRRRCRTVIEETLQSGLPANRVYLDLIWPIMVEIEQLAVDSRINPVQQHLASRINRTIVDQLQNKLPRKPARNKKVVVTNAAGEPTELGAQMIADLFDSDGWDVRFLGAGLNNDDILTFIHEYRPNILLIYGADSQGTPGIRRLIDMVRDINAFPEMKIMLSGGLFNRAEGLWQEIGADIFAPTAAQAVKIAANADQLPPPQPGRSVNRRRKRR